MNIDYNRYSGILLHLTSLPSPYGIGDMGLDAYRYIDKLKEIGVTHWQILPLGPTGYGNSPYSARSCFAGNELLISPFLLKEEGLLTEEELSSHPTFLEEKVEFDKVIAWKLPLLKLAALRFIQKGKTRQKAYKDFVASSSYWLEDYALFMVLYEKYNDARWQLWEDGEKRRDSKTISKLKKEKKEEIEIWYVLQYFFFTQWEALKSYANKFHIAIIGDAPIFAGGDSVDTWAHLEIFKTDEEGHYSAVSGVPPDNFSATGQLWGTPVYNWKKLKETGYEWWFERIKQLLTLTDVLRIDHFRGFDAYYEIKAGDKTAEFGKWVKAPGADFFKTLTEKMGKLPIIAEDLGLMTPSVNKLRTSNKLPGMKIAQFGFTRLEDGTFNSKDDFLPHNYERDYVAYTGTHDNDTTRSWYESLNDDEKNIVREYLASSDEDIVFKLIDAVLRSHADWAIIPMQDLLEKGGEARMNYPSTCNDKNWSWRMKDTDLDNFNLLYFSHLLKISGRHISQNI